MPPAWETGSASTRLACVAALIKPHLVMSAKQRRYPCSGPSEFRISLQAYWQIDIFLCVTSQSWRVLKFWYLGGGPQFRRCFADRLNQKFSGHSMPCKDLVFILSLSFSIFFSGSTQKQRPVSRMPHLPCAT